MSETVQIPKGWKEVTLNDVASPEKNSIVDGPFGSNLLLSDYIPDGEIPVLNIKMLRNISDIKNARKISMEKYNEIKRSSIKGGDILIGKIASVGLTCLYPKDYPIAIIPANLCKITPNLDIIDTKFLKYWLDSSLFKKHLNTIVKKTAQPAFGISNFKTLPIPLPPIPIQKKIVQKLDDILGQLEEKKKEILKILELQKKRQLLLSNNYLSHKTAELIPVENAPNHWKLIKLGDTFNESDKKWLPNGKSELVNYIGLENIESNTGNLVRFSPTESSKIKSNKTIFTKNMVLYGKLRPYLNKVILPTFDGICSTDILGLNPKSIIDRTFLAYFLRSWHVLYPVNRSVHGTRMPRTKIQVLQEIPIALPPIGEQKEIIKKIIQSDKTTAIIKNSIQEIQEKAEKSIQCQEHLQSSILDTAFSGKLFQ